MSKIKVSHTIDEEFIKWMDSQIAKKRFASRSHAIEYALQQLIDSEKPSSAHVSYIPESHDLILAEKSDKTPSKSEK